MCVLGDAVELGGRDARPDLGLDEVEDLGDDAAGAAHALDLGAGLAGDHRSGALGRGRVEGRDEAGGGAGDADRAVDGREDAPAAVVVDDLEERRHLLVHARADGRLGVVGALEEGRPVEVADARDLRRVRGQVVDVPVGRADPAVRQALDEVLERDVDVERRGRRGGPRPGARRRAPRPGPRSAGTRRGSRRPARRGRGAGPGRPGRSCRRGRAGRGSCSGPPRGRAPSRPRRRRGAGRPMPAPGPRVERREPGPGCPCRHRGRPAGRRPSWPRAADPVGAARGARDGQGGHRMKPS